MGEIYFAQAYTQDKYRLRINTNFFVEQPTRPNAWFRFWQHVLLGWTWESK